MTSACGSLTSSSTQSSGGEASLSKANAAFSGIKDSESASAALNQILKLADTRTGAAVGGQAFLTAAHSNPSISDDLKSKLIRSELQFRKKGISIQNTGSDEDIQVLISQMQAHTQQGMSAQQVADALNAAVRGSSFQLSSVGAKIADVAAPFDANDVQLIRDKTLTLMPNSGDPTTGISPLEALVIGYVAASDDDGEKPDGTVNFFASDEMKVRFMEQVVSAQAGAQ